MLAILDEELQHLPERLRLPLILCCLEGRSQDEAATVLGWTAGAVKGRLERGRQRLKDRLARRGVAFAVGAGIPLLAASPSIAGVRATALLACRSGASVSAAVAALLHETLKPVFSPAVKMLLAVLAIGLLAGGGALALRSESSRESTPNLAPVDVAHDMAVVVDDQDAEPLPQGAPARLGAGCFRSDGEVQTLTYSPNGKILVGQVETGVVLWDAVTGQEVRRLPVRRGLGLTNFGGLAISPDSTILAVIEGTETVSDNEIGLWDMNTGRENTYPSAAE